MLDHQGVLVIFSVFLILKSVSSYDMEEIEESLYIPASEINDEQYFPLKDKIFYKRDPILDYLASSNRHNDDVVTLMNKRMSVIDSNFKDSKMSGKPSLSIISPLEALQRKVAVVYNTRQQNKNRMMLDDIGKRAVVNYVDAEYEQNEQRSQDKQRKNKRTPRVRIHGFYPV